MVVDDFGVKGNLGWGEEPNMLPPMKKPWARFSRGHGLTCTRQ